MKITLISTATFPSDQGIRTISSVLKKEGHKVKIIFMAYSENYLEFYKIKELNQLLNLCKHSDIVGISSYASTAPRAIQVIKFLKKNLPDISFVWGGVHATISPESCINHVDIVCVGEGEKAIVELLQAIEKKKPIKNIKNLWIRENGKIIKNPIRDAIEKLDELPFADYDIEDHYILERHNLRKFREKDLGGGIFFLTGRGCPYGCTYCSNNLFNKLYKGKCKSIVRWHSADYMIKFILNLRERFKSLNYFDIRDDTFSLRPISQIKEFCEKYKKIVNMRFKCLGDPKTISEEKIKLLVDAGCSDIIIGIQGVERVNKEVYLRNQTDEEVIKAGNILNKFKNKLVIMYDVITCNPYESEEDILNMIRLLQKLPKPYFLSVNNLVFFPGSGLYDRAVNDSLVKKQVEASYKLNYWDRRKHILLKRKNIYLVLILNLMRGSVTKSRFGALPNSLINYLLKPEIIRKNKENHLLTYFVLSLVGVSDTIRERIAKQIFRSMPVNFKVWYDKVRYKV